ncbi:MAG: hypothetical protein HYY24_07830 [Verrucomicrobia bacterium]|nr:hypothetical protein [Verrucomicrobiota bacterium]
MARGGEVALDFQDTFRARGYELLITPRVVTELRWLELYGNSAERKEAGLAFTNLRQWSVKPVDLSSLAQAIAWRFADALMRKRLIPEGELGDARVLGETAVAGVPVLVTFDKHLLGVDDDELCLAADEADLPRVSIVHPGRLLRAIR